MGQRKPWVASTANGQNTTTIQSCQLGVTYQITYQTENNLGYASSAAVQIKVAETGTQLPPTGTQPSGGVYKDNASIQQYIYSLGDLVSKLVNQYSNLKIVDPQTSINTEDKNVPTGISSCLVLQTNLKSGDSGTDVLALSEFLVKQGFLTSKKLVFDSEMATAVKLFQEKNASQILVPLGLSQGTGIVAEKTREFIRTLTCVSGN